MPRQAVVLGAGGGARAVVYGLITEGFQRVVIFNRHLHRAEGLVRHFGRSASHMELRAMPWHESVIEAELSKTKVLINATAIGLTTDETPIPAELLPPDLLVLDLIYNPTTRLLRDAQAAGDTVPERRADAPPPGRGGIHALDGAAGAARADAAQARRGTRRRHRVGRGRARRRGRGRIAVRHPEAGAHGPVPLSDGR